MEISDLIEFIYKGKSRKNGSKSATHLYFTRKILEDEGITDGTILDAALLHDVLEDTHVSREYLALKFGERVADLVELLSKEPRWKTSYCKMKSNVDGLKDAWFEHPEAVLIKMADRLHNLQTIDGFSKVKQQEYLSETKTLLLPLFRAILKHKHIGYLKTTIRHLLRKLSDTIHAIETRLS